MMFDEREQRFSQNKSKWIAAFPAKQKHSNGAKDQWISNIRLSKDVTHFR